MERIIITLATAGIGGFIGLKLKIPAGALIGSMIAVAVFNILVGKGEIPMNFKIVAQIVVGGMIGLNYTMDTVKEMKSLIVPAVILVVGLFFYSVVLGYIIHRVSGLDLVTALFSSAPGGLADMTIISEGLWGRHPESRSPAPGTVGNGHHFAASDHQQLLQSGHQVILTYECGYVNLQLIECFMFFRAGGSSRPAVIARELRKQLIWCKSKADSIVWMEEERAESDYLFALPFALVFLTPGLF